MRRIVGSLVLVSMVLAGLVAPVDAARPADPYVSRLVGTVHWVTETDPPHASLYVFDVTLSARNIRHNDTMCVKVTWPGQDPIAESGYGFPRVHRGLETSIPLQVGEIPDGAATVIVTAQLMHWGARDCCIPVGPVRTVIAALPDPVPPIGSDPVVVFDERYSTP